MTNDEYLGRLNEALQADPDFVLGMAFVHVPESAPAERAQGYDWVKIDGKDSVYRRIGARVRASLDPIETQGNVQNPDNGQWLSYSMMCQSRADGWSCSVFFDDSQSRFTAPGVLIERTVLLDGDCERVALEALKRARRTP